ncbi:hypothetical protein IQ31_03940 [Sphingobacterium siyangense]|uniref:Uncharacterized protein n=2 Tax=Sphingobacterium siyangense TaxID=459529 RepID=A0A562MBD1_9SPHI|nr:hypothetical protein IQ31_03940 [Sphingobacterium siyangense]
MTHEPKLAAYVIELKPSNSSIENSNRQLFRYKIGDILSEDLEDSFIFIEMCRLFIASIDTDEMYSDTVSKKCLTANQIDLENDDVNTTIRFHSEQFIIEGVVEGGKYGKKRNKTFTENKAVKDVVSEKDAITDDFYFLLYCPLSSKKSILLLQSYTDDSIDAVMKKFWKNFLSFPTTFNHPRISKYVPERIINDFKNSATISNFTYTTDMPGETLLQSVSHTENQNFKITIKIEPTKNGVNMEDLENIIAPIEEATFKSFPLGMFNRKKGTLKDSSTGKTTPFELDNNFEIKPSIVLSKYISINHDESDFERIKDYSFKILEDLKKEIFLQNAVHER